VFKDKKLSNLNNHVLITTTDFTLALPRIFENINLKPEQDISLVDLGLMTSAAPTFFKAQKYKWQMINHDINDTNICERVTLMREFQEDKTEKDPETNHSSVIMDGGLLENIPIISTYTTLKTEYGVHPEDIDMFVIGAGDLSTEKNHTINEVNSWSVFDTLKNLIIPYITDSNEMTSLYWGLQMGFNSFKYYNPIKISGSMDNLSIMPDIEKQCLEHKQEFIDEINKFINA
jgi:patatin-like phospholipase/acyl hydrolase